MTAAGRAPVRVCIYGLGSIGTAAARALLASGAAEITGVIDTDPAKAGRDLRTVLRLRDAEGSPRVTITADPGEALDRARADVVMHTTGSFLADVAPQLEKVIDAGLPCVSSCEEMAFPEAADPSIAARLDRRARDKGVALLGTGVNPGFAMDALVLAFSGATREVSHIAVERVLDPLSRRRAFQKKVGLGMTNEQASRLVAEGRMGHVGLKQSALLVARGMGWEVSSIDEKVQVLCDGQSLAPKPRRSVRPGAAVIGLRQTLAVREGSRERLHMEMVMAAGVEAPHDAITIEGTPRLSLWIQGGIPGDEATVSCLINGMAQVLAAPRPGLLTLLDLPLRPSAPDARRVPTTSTP